MTPKKKTMKMLKITQVHSQIGSQDRQRKVLAGSVWGGSQSVIRPNDACIKGMVRKVNHLVAVEEVEG